MCNKPFLMASESACASARTHTHTQVLNKNMQLLKQTSVSSNANLFRRRVSLSSICYFILFSKLRVLNHPHLLQREHMEPSCHVCRPGETETKTSLRKRSKRDAHLRQDSVCYRLEKEAISYIHRFIVLHFNHYTGLNYQIEM